YMYFLFTYYNVNLIMIFFIDLYFFFQAEDGIRDRNVTGVQTCALPISQNLESDDVGIIILGNYDKIREGDTVKRTGRIMEVPVRSEERRVGKECRSRWWAYHEKEKRVAKGRERAEGKQMKKRQDVIRT